MRTTTTDETDAPTDNENTAAAGEETSLAAELPDKIYNGEEVRFLTVLHTGYDWYTSHEIYAEGMNGQLINDAVFHRNTVVEMLLDIKIAETKGTMESLNLRPIEQAKIACAKKLFNEISTSNVKYHDVDSYQSLLTIMNKL